MQHSLYFSFIGGQKACNAKAKYKQHVGNKCFKKTHLKTKNVNSANIF